MKMIFSRLKDNNETFSVANKQCEKKPQQQRRQRKHVFIRINASKNNGLKTNNNNRKYIKIQPDAAANESQSTTDKSRCCSAADNAQQK